MFCYEKRICVFAKMTATILFLQLWMGIYLHKNAGKYHIEVKKTFEIDQFTNGLQKRKILENWTEHDLNSIYDYEKDLKSILNKHAPVKYRCQRRKHLLCMKKDLRGVIYRKRMLYSQDT